ncbi:hypothetical protein CgunFtcFv8_006700 [Champsocephalus gunnari]|uniref:Uncharacterized protein n=1 Tax=Champsocephalus gunnari TaxID=52237 RepID=A0AAN8BXV0_CHAGU|nr:hypothetical protein CgunFtcFv8_006700 [Champsocephalus gunnari]
MARLLSSLALFCRVQAFPCLLLCYLLYILLGGLVFWAVEGPVEQQLRVEVEELRRSFLQENPCVRGGPSGGAAGQSSLGSPEGCSRPEGRRWGQRI